MPSPNLFFSSLSCIFYQELRARAGKDGGVAQGVHYMFWVPAVAVHHVVAVLRHVGKVSLAILVLVVVDSGGRGGRRDC
jgi:hypothetical protein